MITSTEIEKPMVSRKTLEKMRDKAVFGFLAGGMPGRVTPQDFWTMAQVLTTCLLEDEVDLSKRVVEIREEMAMNLKGAAAKYLAVVVPLKQVKTNGKT